MDKELNEKSLILSIVSLLHYTGIIQERASNFAISYNKAVSDFFDTLKNHNNYLHNMWQKHFSGNEIDNFTGSLSEFKRKAKGIVADIENSNIETNSKNLKTRLIHLISQVTIKENSRPIHTHPIEKFTYNSIFPEDKNKSNEQDYYKNTYESMVKEVQKIVTRAEKENNLLAFASALDSLFYEYTSNMPAYLSDNGVVEISLYEYAKTSSAYISLLYYQEQTGILNNDNNFAVIRGDFFSIQSFIFNKDASSKYSPKSLRGKSFYVSLLSDLACLYIIEELGLSHFNIMMNAAGQFVIISYNDENTSNIISNIKSKIDEWLYNRFYCSVSMGLSLLPCSQKDFKKGEFDKIIQQMVYEKEKAKLTRFNLPAKEEFVFKDYDKSFSNKTAMCDICTMEPGTKAVEDLCVCDKCYDYVLLGEKLTTEKYLNIYYNESGIFNRYKYDYGSSHIKDAVHRMHIDLHDDDLLDYNSFNVIHYRSYVVRNSKGRILLFDEISDLGSGASVLAVLKADVDNLGLVFACGLSKKDKNQNVIESKMTFSKINMISRNIHNFFSYYLSHLMERENLNVHTVFAGGDDLFIVGKYNDIVKLSILLNQEFNRFTGYNSEISISAGIELFKGSSIWYVAEKAEERLNKAKNYRKDNIQDIYKGNIDVLYSTNKYEDFIMYFNEFNSLIAQTNNVVSKGFYYKLMDFCDMESDYQKNPAQINNLMWRSRLYNYIVSLKLESDINDQLLKYLTAGISMYPDLIKTLIALKLYDLRNKDNKEI